MKHIDFELQGNTYALSFTAEALFTLYDKFGVTGDILGVTHILEPTAEGWKNCCWLAALLASRASCSVGIWARPRRRCLPSRSCAAAAWPVTQRLCAAPYATRWNRALSVRLRTTRMRKLTLCFWKERKRQKKQQRRGDQSFIPGSGGCAPALPNQRLTPPEPR